MLLAVPELLAHSHLQPGHPQVQVDGVQRGGRGQSQGGQPNEGHQTPAELAACSLPDRIGHNHVTVHSDGHEGQDGSKDGRRLHDHDKVTHVGAKDPSTLVKGVGGGQRDAEDAHEQVDEGQVADEEVGGVVSLLAVPDEVEEEEVAGAGDQDHGRVERDEDKLQVRQEVQAGKGRSREGGGEEERVRGVTAGGGGGGGGARVRHEG